LARLKEGPRFASGVGLSSEWKGASPISGHQREEREKVPHTYKTLNDFVNYKLQRMQASTEICNSGRFSFSAFNKKGTELLIGSMFLDQNRRNSGKVACKKKD
jgi:hypothetical protein